MIKKKLIHFNTYSAFAESKSQLYDWTIAFIKETKQIYTHQTFYDCDIEDINELNDKIDEILADIYVDVEVDATNGVYIQATDGLLYTEADWDGTKTPNGIAVITDNCRFVMALTDAHTSSCQWGGYGTEVSSIVTTTDESTAMTDYDGDLNTTAILGQLGDSSSAAPAAYYCHSYTFPDDSTGYLGAAGEWQAALDNKDAITSALSKCGGTSMSGYYWTSTQYSSTSSWYMYLNVEYLDRISKDEYTYLRAFSILYNATAIGKQSLKDKLAELESSKQDTLISGTTIKTINGESILGEGDLTVEGGITSETDPIFSASPAAEITDEDISSWNNKVDKVDGKQLSTEDFTTLLKQKLDDLSNYDDTAIQESVSKLRTDLDTLVSGDTTTAIKTFNEVIAFLDGLEDTEDLASIIASIEQQIAAKGTVTSITAGEGLTGGTINESGTIALEESGVTAKKYPSNTASWATDTFVDGSAYDVKRIINMTGNITVDKYGRITNATLYNNGVNIYYPKPATTSLNGLMTASDKTKLDGIDMSTKQDKIEVVNHGTSDTTFTLTPNVYHKWGEVTSLSFTFIMGEPNEYNEYMFEFVSGNTPTTLMLPSSVSWVTEPVIEANKTYQVSILNYVGIIVGV